MSSLLTPASSPSRLTSAAAASAAVACSAGHRGELLNFIRDLQGESIMELTAEASPEVVDAMDAFIARLMGTDDVQQLRSMSSQFDSNELSKVCAALMNGCVNLSKVCAALINVCVNLSKVCTALMNGCVNLPPLLCCGHLDSMQVWQEFLHAPQCSCVLFYQQVPILVCDLLPAGSNPGV
jgi:hypothetical protein